MVTDVRRQRVGKAGSVREHSELAGLSLRVVLVFLLFMLGISYAVTRSEVARMVQPLGAMGLPSPYGILTVCVMFLVNVVLRRCRIKFFLKSSDLVLLYLMTTIGGMIVGLGLLGLFPFTVMGMQKAAYAYPEYWGAYLERVPSFILPQSQTAVFNFWLADGPTPWGEWMIPLIMWGLLFLAMMCVYFFIATIVYEHWVHRERLSFPLVQPVVDFIKIDGNNESVNFWATVPGKVGLILSVLWVSLGVLHRYYPSIPTAPTGINFNKFFSEEPWKSGVGFPPWLNFTIRLDVIGIGYFIATDLLFSLWFFFLIPFKASHVVAVQYGIWQGEFPYLHSSFAYYGIAIMLVWNAKGTLREIFQEAVRGARESRHGVLPMSYRAMFILGIVGFLCTVSFFVIFFGMSWAWSIALWSAFFIASFTFARIRAETGVPVHTSAPQEFKLNWSWLLGGKTLGDSAKPMTFEYVLFNFGGMSANILEGYKMASVARIRPRAIVWAILIAFVAAYVMGLGMMLPMIHEHGAETMTTFNIDLPQQNFNSTRVMTDTIQQKSYAPIFAGTGFVMGLLLAYLRTRFLWWPFHPIGYIASMQTFIIADTWSSFMIVWIIKAVVLRYGGASLYQKLKPFFVALIIGSVLTNTLGTVIGILVKALS